MPKEKPKKKDLELINERVALHPVWLTVSEAAKIMGGSGKTVRRAIQNQILKYKIIGDRYFIDTSSLLHIIYSRKKLLNKFIKFGLGQYVEKLKNEDLLVYKRGPYSDQPAVMEDSSQIEADAGEEIVPANDNEEGYSEQNKN